MKNHNKFVDQAGAEMDMSAVELDETPRVSAEITKLLQFPFAAQETSGHTLDGILNHLPPQPRAWSLYETYAEHASWIFGPVKRDEIIDEILSPIYKAIKEKQTSGSSTIELISPHKAAVLFFVFALGALVDLTVEPCELSHSMSFARALIFSPPLQTTRSLRHIITSVVPVCRFVPFSTLLRYTLCKQYL